MNILDSLLNFLIKKTKEILEKVERNEKKIDTFYGVCKPFVNKYPDTEYNRGFVFEPPNYNPQIDDRYFIMVDSQMRFYIGFQPAGSGRKWKEIK